MQAQSTAQVDSIKTKKPLFVQPKATVYDEKGNRSYFFVRLIGEGGFAQCYEVYETKQPSVKYACKVVCKADIKKPKYKQKLLSEIKIHKSVDCKGTVKLHSVFEDPSCIYMIMELCSNKTLSDLLRKNKRFSEERTREYILQIIEPLRYLHSRRIIHRDLKLGNIFLDTSFCIRIGDFGLATIVEDGERKKTICGTPNYIAPEILFDKQNGHSYEVDCWSLGVIAYTMAVGRPPFQTAEISQIYKNIKELKYDFPKEPRLSEEFKKLVRGLLTINPTERLTLDDVLSSPFIARAQRKTMVERLYETLEAYTKAPQKSEDIDPKSVSMPLSQGLDAKLGPSAPAYILDYAYLCGGVAYKLSDGTTGLCVREGKSLISNGSKYVECLEQTVRAGQKIISRERMCTSELSEELAAVYRQLCSLYPSFSIGSKEKDLDFVVKHANARNCTVFRLSSSSVQFVYSTYSLLFYCDGNCLINIERGFRSSEVLSLHEANQSIRTRILDAFYALKELLER